MRKIALTLLCISSLGYAQQNLKENFSPLKSSGTLPDIFTQNIRNVIKSDITELNKQHDKDNLLKQTYLTEANYEIERIVKSGNTLVNDEITIYLNKLADIILKDNPTLRNELHIYTLKSDIVNAYSYDKGYIFINIGLIAQAETEAQLAYILCHEISHYVKKHHIQGYVKNEKIDKRNYNGQTDEDKFIEKCQYSKDHESEADIEGFKLFEKTNYNFKQAEKAFDVLQYSHLPFELQEFKKTFLETEKFKLPASYFLKEVSSIRNNSNEDDAMHTHPNTSKRKQAIAELIATRNNNNKVNNILGNEQFDYVRDLSRMELCRLYLISRDYPNALYAAYILNNKYPNNQYVAEIISKCLYAITLYKNSSLHYNSESYLRNGIPSYGDIESYPQQVYHLIDKMPSNEFTMMSLNYIYRTHKKFPDNKYINAYADSLFKTMSSTNWGIFDFVRIDKPTIKTDTIVKSVEEKKEPNSKTDLISDLQKQNNFKNYDTAYYKEMFLDLFISDKEFTSKFPMNGTKDESSNSGFSNYNPNKSSGYVTINKSTKKGQYITNNLKIEKVILLEPFYWRIDDGKEEKVQYVSSDEHQEKLITTVNECANKQAFTLITIDPGLISASESDKMNDYSIINDYFEERFDGSDKDSNPIFNTNEIQALIAKYGTPYVLKTGIVNYKLRGTKKQTFYYAYLYNIETNDVIYKKLEQFNNKDAQDLIKAKVYQTFYELKHSKKS